jgi:hypothetical protein
MDRALQRQVLSSRPRKNCGSVPPCRLPQPRKFRSNLSPRSLRVLGLTAVPISAPSRLLRLPLITTSLQMTRHVLLQGLPENDLHSFFHQLGHKIDISFDSVREQGSGFLSYLLRWQCSLHGMGPFCPVSAGFHFGSNRGTQCRRFDGNSVTSSG